ncbi:MAG: type III pantothenate kinase [Brumimicrobium sp.]|nr:type III pantothenate kinase [Brumimicrobium sp.]
MSKTLKYRIIDAGNTSLKIVDFQEDVIFNQMILSWSDHKMIQYILQERDSDYCILSSVVDAQSKQNIIALAQPTIVLDNKTALPISLQEYETPDTLGADRIANAVAASKITTTEAALVIDIGTCIKFDLVDKNKYLGGSISPGYAMRLNAMHHFTGALPQLELENHAPLIGKSTKESMLSGVINGIQAEIEGLITKYQKKYASLTIFLTGGDYKRFEIELKNSIFAVENLTVTGLFLILKHNV